jgi:hypothetical protein
MADVRMENGSSYNQYDDIVLLRQHLTSVSEPNIFLKQIGYIPLFSGAENIMVFC